MKQWLYLVLLLTWILVIGLQWTIGWKKLWHERHRWSWPVLGLGAYFTFADAIAIQQHIWFFNPAFITGWAIGNVPVEEVLFYFLTTTIIVQGFVMLFPHESPSKMPPDRRR